MKSTEPPIHKPQQSQSAVCGLGRPGQFVRALPPHHEPRPRFLFAGQVQGRNARNGSGHSHPGPLPRGEGEPSRVAVDHRCTQGPRRLPVFHPFLGGHVPGTGLPTWRIHLVAGLGSHWAGVRGTAMSENPVQVHGQGERIVRSHERSRILRGVASRKFHTQLAQILLLAQSLAVHQNAQPRRMMIPRAVTVPKNGEHLSMIPNPIQTTPVPDAIR